MSFLPINRTGVVQTYQITGVDTADISGADISGTLDYGQRHDLSYTLTTSDKTMVFTIGDVSASVAILAVQSYSVAVQNNVVGDPVFAFYNATYNEWHNQPDLSFSGSNIYEFDLSSSVIDGSYTLVFGVQKWITVILL